MDIYSTVFELIDMRSFSNLWFWITLAYVWSAASHYVIGVPYDMVARATKYGGQVDQDLKDLVRSNANRFTFIADNSGIWLVGFGFFILTALALLGFYYKLEFSQALFLIFAPLSLVFALSVRCARRIDHTSLADIRMKLRRQRLAIQVIGMLSILVTSMWGMLHNLSVGVLGG
ncbi:component of SufBCD complex [uncultured Litoreibacter sp.]|uniref:component of SufBCD complex n=1 Tax=uncultured Litoreibacter sp. TaxID=1392394 RepID=UPI002627C4EF|nr:component of SufBCD complex [uncultured Litoreibacter sp.]